MRQALVRQPGIAHKQSADVRAGLELGEGRVANIRAGKVEVR